MTYNQFTLAERYTISRLRITGHSVARISEIPGRHRSATAAGRKADDRRVSCRRGGQGRLRGCNLFDRLSEKGV